VLVVGDGVVGDGQACNGRTADAVSSEAFLGSVWVCGVLVVALCEFVLELFGFYNRPRLGITMSFKVISISFLMILLQKQLVW
jgi:hypothetical protein